MFRLTCREIASKTRHLFLHKAFSVRDIDISPRELARLVKISSSEDCALAVERIEYHSREMSFEQMDHLRQLEGDIDPETDRSAPADEEGSGRWRALRHGWVGIETRDYVERSGTDTAMLTLAFQKFQNLRSIRIHVPHETLRNFESENKYGSQSISHIASVLMAAIRLSGVQLEVFRVDGGFWTGGKSRGIAIQELDITRFGERFGERTAFNHLKRLELRLSFMDLRYRGKPK